MNQINTTGIILSRTDFGEADRILTLLTPDHGKLRLVAKGVRRVKSKLAGGIELFSVSDVAFIRGRGELGTLISTRLLTHYGRIVKDIQRTMLGYDLIKMLNKATEDNPEAEYFQLLQQAFEALDDAHISQDLIRVWFVAQLVRLSGRTPNLQNDTQGNKLESGTLYDFDFENMTLVSAPKRGCLGANHVKFLRLVFAGNSPRTLQRIANTEMLVEELSSIILQLSHV